MKLHPFEKNPLILATGAFLIFAVGALMTTVLPPLVDPDLTTARPGMHVLTEQEARGRTIYLAEGCVYCHTQQIRNLDSDRKRYGWRLVDAATSESWEYVNDTPHFLGTKRTGPDLARVGGKYSSEWHWAHFQDPRNLGEKFPDATGNARQASIMPSYRYLTLQQIKDLTSFVQTLGRQKNWRKDKNGKELNDYEK